MHLLGSSKQQKRKKEENRMRYKYIASMDIQKHAIKSYSLI